MIMINNNVNKMLFLTIIISTLLAVGSNAIKLPVNARSQQQQQHQQQKAGHDNKIQLIIPDIRPDRAEQYLCMSHRLPANDPDGQFIVGFEPKADASRVHHMLIYGCQLPGIYQRDSPNFVWDCSEMETNGGSNDINSFEQGPVCSSLGKQELLYGWALDAPSLKLPKGVGFKVGGAETNINFLILQVHYGHHHAFELLPDLTDNSGIVLNMKPNQPSSGITKRAGVMVLISLGRVLQGKSRHEIWCDMDEDIEIHPFRYRVHTHQLGTRVFGAKISNKNNERNVIIGAGDPQKAQMFYPVKEKNLSIKKGDTIYGQCEYNNNKTRAVNIGQTANDEMCNFYLMYWTNSSNVLEKANCFGQNPRSFLNSIY